jgi:hypothetical protein
MLPCSASIAQELEPRLYRNAPVGLNAFVLAYGFSEGNVLFDTSLPIEDVQADLHVVLLAYLRTFNLGGRLAKIEVVTPVSTGHWEGFDAGVFRTRDISGFVDPRIRFAVNFVGSPAMDAPDFRKYQQKTIVGASLQVAVPLGQYDPEKLINLGTNRWSLLPEVAVSRAFQKWYFEAASGVWFFTENDDFFGGRNLKQNPILFVKGHVVRILKPRVWLSFNFGLAYGGETKIDGVLRNNFQKNTRFGLTFSFPLAPRNTLKLAFASGVTTRIGADFNSVVVAYQYTWGV